MNQIFETMMLVFFGASWPFNIATSLRVRSAKGKSIIFEWFIIIGYLFGVLGKIVSHDITYVLAVYILDILMVVIDMLLTIRNQRYDRLAAEQEAQA